MYKGFMMSIISLLFAVSPVLAGIPGDGERMAQTCAACHGTRGASPGSHIPVFGGQSVTYLKKTLKEYREGTRPGGVMTNLAKGYTEGQIEEISTAAASWKWINSPFAVNRSKVKKIAGVTESCAACHGKKGEGTALAPHIYGQAPAYLKEALLEYKSGARKAPEMGMVKNMSDAELDSLVTFYSRK